MDIPGVSRVAPEMDRNAKQTSNFQAAGPTRQLPPNSAGAIKIQTISNNYRLPGLPTPRLRPAATARRVAASPGLPPWWMQAWMNESFTNTGGDRTNG